LSTQDSSQAEISQAGNITTNPKCAPGGNDSVELLETEQQCINEAIAVVNANLELRVGIR